MTYIKVTFWQVVGFLRGLVTALFLPLMVILWFFGAIGFLACTGMADDGESAQKEMETLAKLIERGWNRITDKNKTKKS